LNTVTYVAIEPTELTVDTLCKAKQGSNVLHVRGTMQFITTFKLNGDVTINQAAGAVVTQQSSTQLGAITMGSSTEGKGKLLNSLSGTSTSFEVHFPPDVKPATPSIVAGTGLSNQQTYHPDSAGKIFFGAVSSDADIEGSEIASVSERTIYKFTDYGRGTVTWPLDGTTFSCPPNTCTVKTNGVNANCAAAFQNKNNCDVASNFGNGPNDDCIFNSRSARCSGSPSCTRNPEDLNEVTCTVPGPATTLMLIGPSNIKYTFDQYGTQSAPYNSAQDSCIAKDGNDYSPNAACLALKGINLWPVVDPLAASQTPVLALTFLGNDNSYTNGNVENIQKIIGITQPVNTDDRYVGLICSLTLTQLLFFLTRTNFSFSLFYLSGLLWHDKKDNWFNLHYRFSSTNQRSIHRWMFGFTHYSNRSTYLEQR